MATDDGFLRAILADPAADDLRLIYADWLEEQGRAERAEFIRVQVELAKLPAFKGVRLLRTDNVQSTSHGDGTLTCFVEGVVRPEDLPKHPPPGAIGRLASDFAFPLRFRTQGKNYEAPLVVVEDATARRGVPVRVRFRLLPVVEGDQVYYFRPCSDPADDLRLRCHALLNTHGGEWLPEPVGWPEFFVSWESVVVPRGYENHEYTFRRGLVTEIGVPLSLFFGDPSEGNPGIGPQLAHTCPLERVTLARKEPSGSQDEFWWYDADHVGLSAPAGARHHIPRALFDLLPGGEVSGAVCVYPTREAALEALSRAALAWARQQPV